MPAAPVDLDHNATTPVHPAVAEAMWSYLTQHCGNPSSDSASGRVARKAVDDARERLATLVGAHPDEVTFTSGGTEANNLAIRGAAARASCRRLVTSSVEHPATREPVALLARDGWDVSALPVDETGRVELDGVTRAPLGLGSLILAQNEVGTIQPVPEFAERVHAAGGLAHTDGAQAVGKVEVDFSALGVDLLSVAGHKLYAPKGVGALVVRRGTQIAPLLVGAGQEGGLRPGTENVAGIVALGRAAELALDALAQGEPARQHRLRERLWQRLADARAGVLRLSPIDGCLPNTLMVAVPGRLGREVLAGVPDVVASTGSACHAGVDAPAATLLAMGVSPETALGAIRLSVGRGTTVADVDRAADALVRVLTRT